MSTPALGDRLKNAREDKGMTQADVASRAKTTASMICQIESGKKTPSVGLLGRIAVVVGLNLFGDTPNRQRRNTKKAS